MNRCPDDDELRHYLDDKLAETVAGSISEHLESCSACQAKLEELTARPSLVIDPSLTTAFMPSSPRRDEVAGKVLGGKYRLVEKIGAGGMGSVWAAQQMEPIKRKVAVKLIRAGMESGQVLARFDAERQALAMMDHPNIARVLDGGLDDGRPYFVMELVKGVPITEFCDERRLTVAQRLALFVPVCQAIQHAHQKGIIHRDIKPSNVLVALFDDRPVPKVIDFGVAKATIGTLTEATLDTGFGAVVGTPQYMSPEQATFNNLDIDTRSDVYSLGVLLYELLAGSPPFTKQELEQKGFLEILRVVREIDPPRPSTKLSTADGLPGLSANRSVEPKRLTGLLRNELDWIVMKALEKDRGRRYDTANAFAADVSRYLSGEPVVAHPPSAGYRLRKFVRRNKTFVVAASLIGFALLAGIAGTSYGMVRANEHAAAETIAKNQAERDRDAKEKARKKEEQQREYAQAIADFVTKDFLALTSVEGQERFGDADDKPINKDSTLHDLLDRAARKLDKRKDLDPAIEAEMRWMIGVNYRGFGEVATAVPHLERSVALRKLTLGPDHNVTLLTQHSLAVAYDTADQTADAEKLYIQTFEARKRTLGDEHPDTLMTLSNLAKCYMSSARPKLAIPLLQQALKSKTKVLGANHGDTLICMNNLATAYLDDGQTNLALPLLTEALPLHRTVLGHDHMQTLTCMHNLAGAYSTLRQYDKSIALFEEALKHTEAKAGRDHPASLQRIVRLGLNYWNVGRLPEAIALLEEANRAPKLPRSLSWVSSELLSLYIVAGRTKEAESLVDAAVAEVRSRLPKASLPLASECATIGLEMLKIGAVARAEPLLRESLEIRAKLAPDDWKTFNTRSLLGDALLQRAKSTANAEQKAALLTEAEPLLRAGYEGLKQREVIVLNQSKVRLPEAINRLIDYYIATNKPNEVKRWQAERKKYPDTVQ